MMFFRDGAGRTVINTARDGRIMLVCPDGRELPLDQVLELLAELLDAQRERTA